MGSEGAVHGSHHLTYRAAGNGGTPRKIVRSREYGVKMALKWCLLQQNSIRWPSHRVGTNSKGETHCKMRSATRTAPCVVREPVQPKHSQPRPPTDCMPALPVQVRQPPRVRALHHGDPGRRVRGWPHLRRQPRPVEGVAPEVGADVPREEVPPPAAQRRQALAPPPGQVLPGTANRASPTRTRQG